MIIIGSSNGGVGIAAGWSVLQAGGSALDAVEMATRLVEDNPDDHSVGYGGYPNLLGEVELDASIMDGTTLRAGAVGALKGYRYAISVARRVMEELPHVILVGEGAARFAAEIGMQRENLLTEHAEKVWRAGLEGRAMIDWQGVPELVAALLRRSATLTSDPERVTGTVNFIAQDRQGRIASAVSTSGWAWKYPGRLGDSPIIGGGNYADDRYGAAACTGWGEAAIRAATARSVVLYLKAGYPLEEACREAFRDLAPILRGTPNVMSLVAIDRHGNHCAMTTAEERTYVYQADGMDQFVELPRIVVTID
ncbi:N(4)-(beta-N-acetylglucosaminyl)-L-asparaginase [Roseiflexus castenholzii]|jgi:beta-aspartyl-peptidase (threonine type)|uniref:Asparaginase n=1 Tax=Roseiflexus castenholzii (strain DSM 13941 / HLO8) TaxID=383372 RepID=A7NSA0_ROSCS|nr:N(4)-(beta-N-acetylglucosaminyl)-L-asparaginase [Roseiflexus castenholzii]ABU60446.1 Asparaginase [Roseiflexus castenholzii DSM 13941]